MYKQRCEIYPRFHSIIIYDLKKKTREVPTKIATNQPCPKIQTLASPLHVFGDLTSYYRFDRQDFLSADATFFNWTAVVMSNTADSEDPVWDSSIIQILTECSQNADAALSTRQFAAYTYICLRWSLFSVCDRQQERRSSLDAEGTLRRVRFLSGNGPLSPNRLRDLLQRITGRTLEGCATRHFASNSVFQQYENEIARIVCLIQKFVGPDGRIDLQRLKSAIPYGAPGAEQLQFVLNSCIRTQTAVGTGSGRVGNPTAEEFVNCWADWGVLSCIFQQANEVASQYPTACDVTLN